MTWGAVAVAGVGLVGGMMSSNAAKKAADKQSQQSEAAAARLAEASKWRATGTTNRYGTSSQTVDPNTGQLTTAKWDMSPEMLARQDRLYKGADQALPANFDPSKATQEQYQLLKDQQAPGVERGYSGLLSNLMGKGTMGLATGGTEGIGGGVGLRQANPQMEAYFNAVAQQDATNMTGAQTQVRSMMDSDIARSRGLMGSADGIEDRGISSLDRSIRWAADQRDAQMRGAGGVAEQSNLASQQTANANSGSIVGSVLQGAASSPGAAGVVGGMFGTRASLGDGNDPIMNTSSSERNRILGRFGSSPW